MNEGSTKIAWRIYEVYVAYSRGTVEAGMGFIKIDDIGS